MDDESATRCIDYEGHRFAISLSVDVNQPFPPGNGSREVFDDLDFHVSIAAVGQA